MWGGGRSSTPSGPGRIRCCEPDCAVWGRHTSPLTPRASIHCCGPDRPLWGRCSSPSTPRARSFVAANPTVHCGAVTRTAGQANSVQRLKGTIVHVTLPYGVPPFVSASTRPARPPAAQCRLPSSLILHTFGEVSVAAFHNPNPRFPQSSEEPVQQHIALHAPAIALRRSDGPRQ